MPLAKLFKVMDVNGQYWHIGAPTFSMAQRKMDEWDAELDHNGEREDSGIQSLEKVEDLILGGTRDESLGNYQLIECAHIARPKPDWTLENRMAEAGEKLLEEIDKYQSDTYPESVWQLKESLRAAIEKYNEIPF